MKNPLLKKLIEEANNPMKRKQAIRNDSISIIFMFFLFLVSHFTLDERGTISFISAVILILSFNIVSTVRMLKLYDMLEQKFQKE